MSARLDFLKGAQAAILILTIMTSSASKKETIKKLFFWLENSNGKLGEFWGRLALICT